MCLVERCRGRTKSGRVAKRSLELGLESGQTEEVVLLTVAIERDPVDQTRVAGADLGFRLEVGAARAVPALVRPEIDVTGVVDALQHPLDALDVTGVGRADEEVVR